ncbi:MAG: hypothetical protein HY552_04230 [Elusimicrobia bacterium]|nr:hypothetical protein [Elusimicrobiota bacterium]
MIQVNFQRGVFKRLTAALVAASLVVLSPGLPCYQAMAQGEASAPVVLSLPRLDVALTPPAAADAFAGEAGFSGLFGAYSFGVFELSANGTADAAGLLRRAAVHTVARPAFLAHARAPQAAHWTASPRSRAEQPSITGGLAQVQELSGVSNAQDKRGARFRDPGRLRFDGQAAAPGDAKRSGADSPDVLGEEEEREPGRANDGRVSLGLAPAAQDAAVPAAARPAKRDSASLRGRAVLLVGSNGSEYARTWARVAQAHGVKVHVLEDGSEWSRLGDLDGKVRVLPAMPASADSLTPEQADAVLEEIARRHARRPFAAVQPAEGFEELAGRIVDRLNQGGGPRVLGDSLETVRRLQRAGMRESLKRDPEQATTVRSDLPSPEAAVKAFRDMGGGPMVAARVWSRRVKGIERRASSEQEAAEAWRQVARVDPEGVMMDREWEGPRRQVDLIVEEVLGEEGLELRAVRAAVSDRLTRNGAVLASRPGDDEFVGALLRAAKKLGVRSGAVSAVLAWTSEGPRIEDVSRGVWGSVLHAAEGAALVEAQLFSLLGAAVAPGLGRPQEAQSRELVAEVAGTLVGIVAPFSADPTVRFLPLKRPGDSLGPADVIARIAIRARDGDSPAQVDQRAREFMSSIFVDVRTAQGEVVRRPGDDRAGARVDVEKAHQEVRETAALRGKHILQGYMRGQIAGLAQLIVRSSFLIPLGLVKGGAWTAATATWGYILPVALVVLIAAPILARLRLRAVIPGGMAATTLIWTLGVPAAALLLGGPAFDTAYFALTFLQGVVTAFACLLDSDEGGIGALARRHHFPVDKDDFKDWGVFRQTWSAGLRLVSPLALSFGAVLLATGASGSAAVALALAMAAACLALGVIGLPFYLRAMPKNEDMGNPEPVRIGSVLAEFWAAGVLALEKAFFYKRFGMNSSDRTIYEGVPSVVLLYFGLHYLVSGDDKISQAWGVFSSVALTSVGMLGALAMLSAFRGWTATKRLGRPIERFLSVLLGWARRMTPSSLHDWQPPKNAKESYAKYGPFFKVQFWSTLPVLLVPLGAAVVSHAFWPGVLLAALGSFLFHMYFIAPRVGFSTWTLTTIQQQGYDAAGRDARERLFAIQGSVEMLVTGAAQAVFLSLAVPVAMNLVPLWCVLVGAVVVIYGPGWLFTPEELAAAKDLKAPKAP